MKTPSTAVEERLKGRGVAADKLHGHLARRLFKGMSGRVCNSGLSMQVRLNDERSYISAKNEDIVIDVIFLPYQPSSRLIKIKRLQTVENGPGKKLFDDRHRTILNDCMDQERKKERVRQATGQK